MVVTTRWHPRFIGGAALLAVLTITQGCEEQRRVPYIAPELHNWPKPYEGTTGLTLHVFATGSIEPDRSSKLPGSTQTTRKGLWAFVVKHPQQGLVVWGTGPSHDAGEGMPAPLSTLLGDVTGGVHLEPGADLPSQMQAADLDPDSVRWVVLPNLRPHHAGKVEAFPAARVVVSRQEHRAATAGRGPYRGREFDDVASWKFLDLTAGKPLGTMRHSVDLFDDGSLLLIDAKGPSEGNLALLLRLGSRPILLAGDLAPTAATLRYAAEPAVLDDRDAWWERIWRLKRFKDLDPDLLVVPGSDTQPLRDTDMPEVQFHDTVAFADGKKTPAAQPE